MEVEMMNEYDVESGEIKLMLVARDEREAVDKFLNQLDEIGREVRLGMIIRIKSSEGNFLTTTEHAMERHRRLTG